MSKRFPDKKVTVIMPAYKAEKTLGQTLAAIPRDCVDEIILVDDASPDRTVEVARELGIDVVIRHPRNRGYGGNQKTCYTTALQRGADIVVMVHPDYQYDPQFIPALCEPLARGDADAAFGSRMIHPRNALQGGMPWWKFIANIGLTIVENVILGLRLSEYHSGFRAYSRRALERVPFQVAHDDFVFDSEIIVQLRIANLKIVETPISTRYFPEASMISFVRSCEYGFAICLLLVQYLLFRLGVYTYTKFILMASGRHPCPLCKAEAYELDYGPRQKAALSEYTITESSQGLTSALYHCPSCDHTFVPTAPSDGVATTYAEQACDAVYLREEQGRRATARRLLRHLALLRPPGRLVDVGTGYGFFLAEAVRAGWEAEGIELGRASAAYARSHGLIVHEDSWHHLNGYEDDSLDSITACDVLEHLEDPLACLTLMHRKLKPGGVILLTLPRLSSFFARVVGRRWHAYLPSHLQYFSDQSLNYLITRTGTRMVARYAYWRYFSLGYIASRAREYPMGMVLAPLVALVSSWTVPISLGDEYEVYLTKGAEGLPAVESPKRGGTE